jgi:hypothetical protein
LYNRALYLSSVLPTPKIPHILLLFSTNLVKIMVKELEDMSVQLANREKYRGEKNGVKGFYD